MGSTSNTKTEKLDETEIGRLRSEVLGDEDDE